jgi:hypothetical protein
MTRHKGSESGKRDTMTQHEMLPILVALAGAVIMVTLWKQLLILVLVGVVMIFAYGLYNVAVLMAG